MVNKFVYVVIDKNDNCKLLYSFTTYRAALNFVCKTNNMNEDEASKYIVEIPLY